MMKKVLFVLTMLSSALFVHAQHGGQRLELGLKGGLNIANLSQKNLDTDPLLSFNAGGFVHLHLSEHFAIQPELLFSGQGAKFDILNQESKIKLGYFTLPVLLQYMTNNGFRLETGPQLGVLVSAKSTTNSTTVDVKDSYEDIDFSWGFGASYITASRFGINARYNLGLTNISTVNNAPTLKNNVIQVGVFYQFKTL